MKKLILASAFTITALLSGCGASENKSETSVNNPESVILNKITTDKILGQSNIANLLSDYYSRSKSYVESPNCSNLKSSSKDPIEKSIVSFSKEHCSNINAFNDDMQAILSKINTNKSMDIKFDEINGYKKFIDAKFKPYEAKYFMKHNVSFEAAKKLTNAYKIKALKPFIEHGITDVDTISGMMKYMRSFRDIQQWLDAGVSSVSDLKFWRNNSSIRTSSVLLDWKKLGLEKNDIISITDLKISPSLFAKYKEIGLDTPAKLEAWKFLPLYTDRNFDRVALFVKKGLTSSQIKDASKKIPVDNIVYYLKKGISFEDILKGKH